jgi:tRNA modification GTPase
MQSGDTIAAISSAVGAAARMIVRISGPHSWEMARGLCPGAGLSASCAASTRLQISGMAIPITLYAFQNSRSYTGEDQIEFHLPGNPLIAQHLLSELFARGARAAEPGEFTARAYFHGRLDLTEAEGVAATIAAQNDQELQAARRLLSGELARRLRPAMELIAETLTLIEVGIDFAEEQVSFLSSAEVADRLSCTEEILGQIVRHSATFEQLSHEPRIVLMGRPNAGKSTLLNAMAGHARAVVSAVEGTTRDALSAPVFLKRGTVRLIDVAGVAEEAPLIATGPQSDIDRQMRQRAMLEIETADLVVLVQDGAAPEPPFALPRAADLTVISKADLNDRPQPVFGHSVGSALRAVSPDATEAIRYADPELIPPTQIPVSAHTGFQMDLLKDRLDELAFGAGRSSFSLALNTRHLRSIAESREALNRARALLASESELIALELREALDGLGQILGSVTPDDLLGRIFAVFCIGK